MIKLFRQSKLSVFSRNPCSDSCSISDLGDTTSSSESEESDLTEFEFQSDYDPVQWVIDNEAYCFDVERFSEKLVNAIFLEAKRRLTREKSGFTVFDIVLPLIDLLLNRVFNIEPMYTSSDDSTSSSLDSSSQDFNRSAVFWPKISNFNIKLGQEQIEEYLSTWKRSSDWYFCVEFLGFEIEDCSNIFVYEVEWSKPTMSYPIPQATANVYFALEVFKMVPFNHDRNINVTYVFESSSLIHKPGKIDFQEKWLQDIIDEKIKLFQKMTFAVPAGICSPERPTLGDSYWPNSAANIKCSKNRGIKSKK